MGLGLLVLSILCLIARCCWRPSRYKCVDHALNVLAAVFLYFVLLGVLVRQNPVTVIESALVRPIMRSRPRFILSIGFLQVLFFLTNDSTWRVSAYWSGILNLQKKTWIGRFSAENPWGFPIFLEPNEPVQGITTLVGHFCWFFPYLWRRKAGHPRPPPWQPPTAAN